MSDKQTISAYDSLVDDYLAFVGEDEADPLLDKFVALLNRGDHVLDLGCGPGIAAAYMRDRGLLVDPVDGSLEMVKLANRKFKVGARQARFEEIDAQNAYDGIWANFSLLHASADELPMILSSLHGALVPGGIFHLSMKTGSGSKRDKLSRYYSYYSPQQLYGFLANAGFDVESSEFGEAPGLADGVEAWIAISSSAGKQES